jgi:hypothetical protein
MTGVSLWPILFLNGNPLSACAFRKCRMGECDHQGDDS